MTSRLRILAYFIIACNSCTKRSSALRHVQNEKIGIPQNDEPDRRGEPIGGYEPTVKYRHHAQPQRVKIDVDSIEQAILDHNANKIKNYSHPKRMFQSNDGPRYPMTTNMPELTTKSPNDKAFRKPNEQEVIQRVLQNYDYRVRPHGLNTSAPDTGGPVVVTVNVLLRTISKIDDVNMEYSAQFTFRESWEDPRLAYMNYFPNNSALPEFVILATTDLSQQIWMPDTFFQNEKEARKHNIDKPNVLIRIHPNGMILYSVRKCFISKTDRLSLVLSCPMNLEYYPLDNQQCMIELASYAYTTVDIIYKWKADNPVQQKPGLNSSLPSFELMNVTTGICTSKTSTGDYSCLRTTLILRREFSYYLLQLYIPSFMLVIVSWVSFWLDKDSVPARVTLGVTTLLTMTTQSSGINAKLPPVSYTKAIDVWIGVCLAFIFGALLEFALVNYAARRDQIEKALEHHGGKRKNRRSQLLTPLPLDYGQPNLYVSQPLVLRGEALQISQNNFGFENSIACNASPQHKPRSNHCTCPITAQRPSGINQGSSRRRRRHKKKNWFDRMMAKYRETSKRIDVVSRLVFPVGFLGFNCIYWTVYMA